MSELLNHKAGHKVILTIQRGSASVDVSIKPANPAVQGALEYQAWIDQERALVDKLSNGKVGYMHVAAMDQRSFDLFLREIRTQSVGKEAMLIDVRYNGGGDTAHKLLGVLIKTPWLIRTTRGAEGLKVSENILRGDSLELPTGLLFNSYSFSNAEIMGEGFRQLKRGPIVGERTPGYVIGTGAISLWDGGAVRLPAIGVYAVNGQELENNGRKPDFEVPFDPNTWSQGRDVQLEKAVDEVLKTVH
jgi:C-terminal processing protease CtpA/Prc